MTYGVARAATSPELVLYRKEKKFSKWRAAIHLPRVIYRARINQTFSTTDSVLQLTYDGGSGTLADVLPDMEMYVGSTLDAHDLGIVRLRSKDATHFYIEETSDVRFADNLYLTVVEHFALRARHVLISSGVPYMDGGVAYSDQHANPDPTPIMGSHRVLKLTGATVSTQFNWSNSYVIGGLSTITAYATSAPTAASITSPTTATPTATFNTTGFHPIYLTLTTAGGKSFFGVRWVYVWSDDDPPLSVQISDPRQDVDSGGWEFEILAADGVDLETVPDHALVILFAEDYFDGTQSNIGPVAGSENVEVTGWIAKETNRDDPEHPSTTFTVYTAQYWFGQIPAFPDGVELTTGTPTVWTEIQGLTVDKGLWHLLHWRTTATRVMDVFLTGDTKYTKEVSSLASNLWEQIREVAWLQIYARPGCNAWNQLFVQVHPQLVPLASRDWATVLTIQKGDWRGEIQFERRTKPEVAVVSLSGVAVNESGGGASYFALSPGHAYPHYGRIEVQDKLLVAGQADANQKAGLYRGWQNNALPDVPISLVADLRLLDCFPRSVCAITIEAADTPRGFAYSGNLLPTAVSIVTDPPTGRRYREVTFEAETFEDLNINGDIPGSRADVSIPPVPGLPGFPALPVILPGTTQPSATGPVRVLLHDTVKGLIYTEDFHAASPHWRTVNAGLTSGQYAALNVLFVCPNGAVYVGFIDTFNPYGGTTFLFRAPFIGGTFVQQSYPDHLVGAAVNPLLPETIGFITNPNNNATATLRVGANNSFSAGATFTDATADPIRFSYGFGGWLLTRYNILGCIRFNAAGTAILGTSTPDIELAHIRAGTTGITFHNAAGPLLVKGENNLGTLTTLDTTNAIRINSYSAIDATGMYLMTRIDGGTFGGRGKSSDGGATWSSISLSLPISSAWFFQNAGDPQHWVAASEVIGYTENFGNSWVQKDGDIHLITATPHINRIRVVQP